MKEYNESNVHRFIDSCISFDEYNKVLDVLACRGIYYECSEYNYSEDIIKHFPTKEEFMKFLESEGL